MTCGKSVILRGLKGFVLILMRDFLKECDSKGFAGADLESV
jgi:hypothetical protein